MARDTVYMEVVKEYHYPSYHPEMWYYGVRHHRWRNYYYTPYWQYDYRSDYWSNYWYDYWQRRYPVSPSPGTTSPPVIQSPTSKRRKLRFIKPSQPKDTSTKESKPTYQDVESSDSSDNDEDQDEEQPEKKKSNKRKKLKW